MAWGAAVAILTAIGFYDAIAQPLRGPLVFLGIAIPASVYFASRAIRSYFETLGLKWLTALHIWRIPAALTFLWYGEHGLLPDAFDRNAGWGDFAAGLLTLAVTLGPKTRARYLGMHLFGLADFVFAVGTGLYFTLLQDPRMASIRELPLALIPLWGAGISGASHLIALDLLRRNRVL